MYKFIVTASLLSTALAGSYDTSYSSGGKMSGMSGMSSEMSQYGSGGSSGSGGSGQYGSSGSGGSSQYESSGSQMQSSGSQMQYGGSSQQESAPPMMAETPMAEAQMAESSACAQSGAAATHTVLVGGDQLVYSPESIYANPGDKVWFMFLKKNHTVTQSAFAKPCVKLDGGMDSGFMPSMATASDMSSAPKWEYVVKDTKPTWWYCKQKTGTHCGKGMTFAINPTPDKTYDMFKQMAIKQNGTESSGSGGSSYAAPPPPAQTEASQQQQAPPPPPPSQSMASGGAGECSCSCFCGVGSWPAGYGVGSSGGMAGMLPMPGYSSMPSASAPPAAESTGSSSESSQSGGSYSSGGQSGGSY